MPTYTTRLRSLRICSAAVATVSVVTLTLTGCSGGSGTAACRTVHVQRGEFVPADDARPCIVYGAGRGSHPSGDGGPGAPTVGGTNQTPGKPKTPTIPKVPSSPKAPAAKGPAPAPKAPSLTKAR
ncbi:hypothetical protein ACFY0R_09960 [Streptomyces sp. NPDC001633]|uniref:hypothetical protein n=1 Tax=Streptomyces sp. NPDC001633 TaxID=3364595 RepID=UPI0036B31E40